MSMKNNTTDKCIILYKVDSFKVLYSGFNLFMHKNCINMHFMIAADRTQIYTDKVFFLYHLHHLCSSVAKNPCSSVFICVKIKKSDSFYATAFFHLLMIYQLLDFSAARNYCALTDYDDSVCAVEASVVTVFILLL